MAALFVAARGPSACLGPNADPSQLATSFSRLTLRVCCRSAGRGRHRVLGFLRMKAAHCALKHRGESAVAMASPAGVLGTVRCAL